MRLKKSEQDEIKWMMTQEIPKLRRYAFLLTRHQQKSDDLVQDTLERAIKKMNNWRQEGTIRSWLYRIQYSIFVNSYRKLQTERTISLEDIPPQSYPVYEAPQTLHVECKNVLAAADYLNPEFRDTLMLIAVEGFSYDQTAQIMDVPVGTVRSRLARARKDLREILQNGNAATKQKRIMP